MSWYHRFYYRSKFYQWLCEWEEVKHTVEMAKFRNKKWKSRSLTTREENLKYYNSRHNSFRG